MQKILVSLFVIAISFATNSQIKAPQPSPFQKTTQKVGLTDVTLEYSRPGMRGRTVFGNLVPYGKIWRTGANANTKVTFSTDVTFDGKTLKKGTYAIYTIPNKKTWDVIFYSDSSNWGTPQKWDDAKVAAQIRITTQPMPMNIETFTITFDDLTNNSAVIGILWENVYVGVKFETPTDSMVSESIERTMSGPSANDYYASASYYLEAGKDINQAKKWIDKAIKINEKSPKYWFLRKQSLIHAKAGSTKTAIVAAKQSLELAKKAGNGDYVKMNQDSLKEWGAK